MNGRDPGFLMCHQHLRSSHSAEPCVEGPREGRREVADSKEG